MTSKEALKMKSNKKLIGDLTLRELRQICDSIPGLGCELRCPIKCICKIADNDIKKILNNELEEVEE